MTTSNEPVPRGTTYAVRRATTNDDPPRTLYLLVEYENAGADDQECHLVSTYESWGEAVTRAVALRRRNRHPFEGHWGDPSVDQVADFVRVLAATLPAGYQMTPYSYQCVAPLLGLARALVMAHGGGDGTDRRAREALLRLLALTAEAEELLLDASVYKPDKSDADD